VLVFFLLRFAPGQPRNGLFSGRWTTGLRSTRRRVDWFVLPQPLGSEILLREGTGSSRGPESATGSKTADIFWRRPRRPPTRRKPTIESGASPPQADSAPLSSSLS